MFCQIAEVPQFTNWIESHARSHEAFSFFRPDGLWAIFTKPPPMREVLRSMPKLLPVERFEPIVVTLSTGSRAREFGRAMTAITPTDLRTWC